MFFLFGVKGGLLFLITKKEKSPLKTSLFLEQQKSFNASLRSVFPTEILRSFYELTVALLANGTLYVLTFGIFLKENPIVRTLAIVFDFLTKVCKPKA